MQDVGDDDAAIVVLRGDDNDEDDDKDGDLYMDDLHGGHMLLLHPLLHILPRKSTIVPDRLEDRVHLSAHLCDKKCYLWKENSSEV